MYFDFEENHPDYGRLMGPLTWRDGLFLSLIVHLLVVIAILTMPALPGPDPEALMAERVELERQQQREAQRFVFVAPRVDTPAPQPPPRADLSDKDRQARAPERAKNPTNSLPFARGNSPERVEEEPVPPAPPVPAPQPVPPATEQRAQPPGETQPPGGDSSAAPPSPSPGSVLFPGRPRQDAAQRGAGNAAPGSGQGILSSAIRDLQRYTRHDAFDNRGGGGGAYGPSIQFDTKGVEFGPWIRRFVAQIKRNWFIPYAAMALKGHVVITFYVMKDGTIAALAVPGPCDVEAFNNAAYNALAASNPTQPLPPEYPADRAFFTVTFYYNESPGL